jgi:hypothetical protein
MRQHLVRRMNRDSIDDYFPRGKSHYSTLTIQIRHIKCNKFLLLGQENEEQWVTGINIGTAGVR